MVPAFNRLLLIACAVVVAMAQDGEYLDLLQGFKVKKYNRTRELINEP